jgi:hypothetical protein
MRLGEIGPNARAAAPSLINALSDTNMNSQANISFALKKIGVPTQEFLPKLKETFWSSNAGALFRSAMFIIQIEPSDHDSHQVLTLFATNASLYRYDALSRNDSVEHA